MLLMSVTFPHRIKKSGEVEMGLIWKSRGRDERKREERNTLKKNLDFSKGDDKHVACLRVKVWMGKVHITRGSIRVT